MSKNTEIKLVGQPILSQYTNHKVFNDDKKKVGNVEFELQKDESAD